jgi:hypothetical protein
MSDERTYIYWTLSLWLDHASNSKQLDIPDFVMAARLVMKLPASSSLTRPSARGSSGRRPFSLPCGVPQMRPSQTNSRQALPRGTQFAIDAFSN